MKVTEDIDDALLAEAQALAKREGKTLDDLIAEGLEKIVKERGNTEPFRLKDGSFGGEGLNPELKDATWETIRDIIYEGRGS